MAGDEDKLEIVPEQTVEVRETRKLFRLTPAADNDVSRPQVAIIAADTEDEARQIALKQDVFGRDWRDPQFAIAEDTETSETHVFGTRAVLFRFQPMNISLSQLLEESFQIAWEYLERTGELGDGATASRFLSDTIEAMIRRGQRSRLALSNRLRISVSKFPTQPYRVAGHARPPDQRRQHMQ
jgi:hypothetical protein